MRSEGEAYWGGVEEEMQVCNAEEESNRELKERMTAATCAMLLLSSWTRKKLRDSREWELVTAEGEHPSLQIKQIELTKG